MINLNLFSSIPNTPSVFALYNPKSNKAHLTYAKNTLLRVSKIYDELQRGTYKIRELCENYENLKLVILETYNSYDLARLHMNYWQDYIETVEEIPLYYKQNYLSYSVRISVSMYEYSYETNLSDKKIYVELVSKRNKSFVIGVFDNMIEAESFKNYVETQRYIYPVYAINSETRTFLEM